MNPTDQTPPADDQAVMPDPATMPSMSDEVTDVPEAPAEDSSVQAPSDEVPPAPGM